MTTIFGPDISSYEKGLPLSRLTWASFVIAKTTEGTYYTDAAYQGWRQQAQTLSRLFIWYHFLSGEDAHAQAAHTLANVGDASLPGMLDAEPQDQTKFRPTLAQIIAYIDAAHAAGLNLRLLYLPRWYWEELGEPDLSAIADRDVRLVASSYVNGSGTPQQLYPGDEAYGWQAYGGMTPLLLQFTNQAADGGQREDYNAVRGSLAQLESYLQQLAPVPNPDPTPTLTEDDDMPVFVTGEIQPGAGVTTVVCPPPANTGGAGWGNVWFSLGTDFGDAHVRVAIFVHGQGWSHIYEDVLVRATDDRINPFGGPLPAGVQKISVVRKDNPNVPMGYLIEATHR